MRTEQKKRGGGNIQVEAGGKVLLFLLLLRLPWVGMPEQNGNHASQMVRSSPLWGKRNAQVCSKYLVVVVEVVRTNSTTRDDRFPIRRGTSLILRERQRRERRRIAPCLLYPETPSIQGGAANYSEGPVISWTSEPAPPETRATMVARLRRFHWASI